MLLGLGIAVLILEVIGNSLQHVSPSIIYPKISLESPQMCRGAFVVDKMIHFCKLMCAEYNSHFMGATRLYMEGWSEDFFFH